MIAGSLLRNHSAAPFLHHMCNITGLCCPNNRTDDCLLQQQQRSDADLGGLLHAAPPSDWYIVQRYLSSPYLLDGTKFTLRLYALIPSLKPFRLYVARQGIAKFCVHSIDPEDESIFNDNELSRHITNEAFNKYHDEFVVSMDADVDNIGHRRSLTAVLQQLEERHGSEAVAALWQNIRQTITVSLLQSLPQLYAQSKELLSCLNCPFQLFGIDVDLTVSRDGSGGGERIVPVLIEANVNPALGKSSAPFDHSFRKALWNDTLNLLDVGVAAPLRTQAEVLRRSLDAAVSAAGVNCSSSSSSSSGSSKCAEVWQLAVELNRAGLWQLAYPPPVAADTDEPALRCFYEQRVPTALKLNGWQEEPALVQWLLSHVPATALHTLPHHSR